MATKAFLMQNLSLVALLVLEIWRNKISLGRREQGNKFGYLSPENGFNFLKMSFYVQTEKIFSFCKFWDASMKKEQQQPPDWSILLKFGQNMSQR